MAHRSTRSTKLLSRPFHTTVLADFPQCVQGPRQTLAMTQPIDWRYLLYIMPIKYPHNVWILYGTLMYTTFTLGS